MQMCAWRRLNFYIFFHLVGKTRVAHILRVRSVSPTFRSFPCTALHGKQITWVAVERIMMDIKGWTRKIVKSYLLASFFYTINCAPFINQRILMENVS